MSSKKKDSTVKKKRSKKEAVVKPLVLTEQDGTVISKKFLSFAEGQYYDYGVAVNEDRAIPSILDGMKPVERRLLWAAHVAGITTKTKKSARIVGDTIGKYHPHGDSAAYEAMVTAINKPMPTFEGEGNFGSFSDTRAAAQRYTNAKISRYAMKVFFDPFYTPIIETVPNYDGEEVEPVLLPALLPNLLLNGTQGIGVGLNSVIPAYSADSILKVVRAMFNGETVDAKFCVKTLEYVTAWGATYDKKANKEQSAQIIKTGGGRIVFDVVMKLNAKAKNIAVVGFPHDNMEQVLEVLYPESKNMTTAAQRNSAKTKSKAIQQYMKRAYDASKKTDKTGTLIIELKPGLKAEQLTDAYDYFLKLLNKPKTFNINITHRRLKKKSSGNVVEVALESVSVLQILEAWKEYRIQLEKKAAAYWQGKTQEKINTNELMQLAFKHLDALIKVIRKKHASLTELRDEVAKLLKINEKQAQIIIERKLYQLSGLEENQLKEQHKKLSAQLKDLQKREKKPEGFILEHLNALKI